MRFALVQKDKVVNVVEADDSYQPPKGFAAVASDTANIGDTHNSRDNTMSAAVPAGQPFDQKVMLTFAAENKAAALLDVKAALAFDVPHDGASVSVDVPLGPFISNLRNGAMAAAVDPQRTFKRAFVRAGGFDRVPVMMTAAEISAIHDAVMLYHEDVQSALSDAIDQINRGMITTSNQIDNLVIWPDRKINVTISRH